MKTPEQIAEAMIWDDMVVHASQVPGFRQVLADAVRPLYEQARQLEGLLAVACHDDAGLVELGRREERGRVLGIVTQALGVQQGQNHGRFVLDQLATEIRAGPACNPLPPTAAAARIAKLEGLLRWLRDDAVRYRANLPGESITTSELIERINAALED